MSNYNKEKVRTVQIENTNFIFHNNFKGDPTVDKNGDTRRKACILIPNVEQAKDIMKMGFRVGKTEPRKNDDPDTFEPEYFVNIFAQYWKKDGSPVEYPPKIVLVQEDGSKTNISEETIGILDEIRIKTVDVILSEYVYGPKENDRNFRIRIMYVTQEADDDPFANKYGNISQRNDSEDF